MLKERYSAGKKARLVAAFTSALSAGIASVPVSAGENLQVPNDAPIEIQSNYPEVVGNLEKYGIEIHNNSKEAMLTISDEDLEDIGSLTEKYGTKVKIKVLEEYISDIPTEQALPVVFDYPIYFHDELVEPGVIQVTLAWNEKFIDSMRNLPKANPPDVVSFVEELNSIKIVKLIATDIFTGVPNSDSNRSLLDPSLGLLVPKDIGEIFFLRPSTPIRLIL